MGERAGHSGKSLCTKIDVSDMLKHWKPLQLRRGAPKLSTQSRSGSSSFVDFTFVCVVGATATSLSIDFKGAGGMHALGFAVVFAANQ